MTSGPREKCLRGLSSSPEVPGALEDRLENRTIRLFAIGSVMLALFLGALDSMIMSAAMPTIVSELGGLELYSWVYSSYLLTRTVAVPIFGKLCDLFSTRRLYGAAIVIFVGSSVWGGTAQSIGELILCRAIQGLGAGGTLALAYVVVADLSPPGKRGKMLGFTSFVWGVASILGPALGGLIVSALSWRWIYFINLPLGYAALMGIQLFLDEVREKKPRARVDFAGGVTLTLAVVALLGAFMLQGACGSWYSRDVLSLLLLSLAAGLGFLAAERYADEPLLAPAFFRKASFTLANGSAFFSSFGVFSLLAFTPFFIQGALGCSPAQVGLAMVPLSFGWAGGSLVCGQLVHRLGEKRAAILGSLLLVSGACLLLTMTASAGVWECSGILAIAGVGMGFVATPTLLIVQNSLGVSNLGIATSSQQFARTLGGAIGVGLSGSLVTASFDKSLDALRGSALKQEILSDLLVRFSLNLDALFQPAVRDMLPPGVQTVLQTGVGHAVETVFWAALWASLLSLVLCCLLPCDEKKPGPRSDQV